jgi:hypothetical protein
MIYRMLVQLFAEPGNHNNAFDPPALRSRLRLDLLAAQSIAAGRKVVSAGIRPRLLIDWRVAAEYRAWRNGRLCMAAAGCLRTAAGSGCAGVSVTRLPPGNSGGAGNSENAPGLNR